MLSGDLSGSTAGAASAEFWAWYNRRHRAPRPAAVKAPRRPAPTFGYALTGSGRRRYPTASQREEALNRQRNRCLYCDNEFGSQVRRLGKPVVLKLNWDHFVPYAYGQTNDGANWVAACHVCNGSKSGRMFDTLGEARTYLRERWRFRGFDIAIFPADALSPVDGEPRPLNAALVPDGLARVAEYVSVDLEENAFPVAASGIHIRGVSLDTVRTALNALFESGHVGRASAHGPVRYVSLYPFRAPSLLGPTVVVQRGPLSIACPACDTPPQFKCLTGRGDVKARFHPERIAAANESQEAA